MKYPLLITSLFLFSSHTCQAMEPILKKDGRTPLHVAVDAGDIDCIKQLLSQDHTIINKQDYRGHTALHHVCVSEKFDFAIAELLLREGADITIKSNFQTTPLSFFFTNITDANINQDLANYYIQIMDIQNNTQLHLCAMMQGPIPTNAEEEDVVNRFDVFKRPASYTKYKFKPSLFEKYISFLINRGVNYNAKNKQGKRAVDVAYEAYNELHKQYKKENLPYLKKALNHQEIVMHSFLRVTSRYSECALFRKALRTKIDDIRLPRNVLTHIMHNYYQLNIETIVAKDYDIQKNYPTKTIAEKDLIKQKLRQEPPRLELLWDKPKAEPIQFLAD